MARKTTRVVALALALSLLSAQGVHAGDLNAEMKLMVQNLGGVGNYTAPGAFRGQTMNTYSGGAVMMRIPNKRYQLFAYELPSIRAGCNGIDINGGSLSMMNTQQFVDILKNFGSAMKGVAFQLALKAVSPLFAGVTEYFKDLESKFSISSKSSCELASQAAGKVGDLTGWSVDRACIAGAQALYSESYAEAASRCKANRGDVMAEAKSSSDPSIAALPPFSGNLTWAALKKGDNANLDDEDRQLIMSMIGTVIYDGEANPVMSHQPTISTVSQLLYGEGASSSSDGNVMLTMLRCDEMEKCENPRAVQISTMSMSTKVRDLMGSIMRHIRNKEQFAQPSPEVAFVNMVNEPVYRMMAVATSARDDSVGESLKARYGDVIAADFAIALLSRTVRVGMHALTINSKLNPAQLQDAVNLQSAAQNMLSILAQEKTTLYTKVAGIESMTRELERLQVSLRANSPAKVLSLLDQRSSKLN